MTKIAYQKYRFSKPTLEIIELANDIIAEYLKDEYTLTLRQLYYQFVARGYIPNNEAQYNRLGSIINKGRLAGLIDWIAIEDRLRILEKNSHWNHPSEIIDAAAKQFRLDTRQTQNTYIEVWVEKDALSGVLERVCPGLDVSYMSCRGYVSQSAMWRASIRFLKEEKTREVLIFYLGDHDPSGLDMSRDIENRLALFGCIRTTVERIALNINQIEQYQPPPNPAKITDSRYKNYVEQFGENSWELDALDPKVIVGLIENAVGDNTDIERQHKCLLQQNKYRHQLQVIAEDLKK